MADQPAILRAALAYVERGLAVFPAPPGTKQSHKCAKHSDGRKWGMSKDPAEITADFTRWPDAGIGLPTGAVNGIVVVETDTAAGHGVDGALSLAQLEAKHGLLPDTRKAISPSGSLHYYFEHPGAGIRIKNSASEIGAGVDVRGDGGMVLVPPTVRPGVGEYCWFNRHPIAPMPAWLVELTREKPRTISERAADAIKRPAVSFETLSVANETRDAYGRAALESEIDELIATAPGGRNHRLNRASFSLHQLVAGGELDGGEVEHRLIEASIVNGLVADDGLPSVIATIESGRRAGLQCPRSRPERDR